jgi:hypothetical protein
MKKGELSRLKKIVELENLAEKEIVKISTVNFILKLFNDDLLKQEKKLSAADKAPKLCQHVMTSKAALYRFLDDNGDLVEHIFNSVKYIYKVFNEYIGYKSYKVWLERVD